MNILLLETNLIWSVRLQKTLESLGHAVTIAPQLVEGDFEVAIVNLGDAPANWADLVSGLHTRGMKVIGHAGHKEKALHQVGREAGCDYLATNSELTHKLDQVLEKIALG